MSDPFEALRGLVDDAAEGDPIDADRSFVRALRRRLEQTAAGTVPVVHHPGRNPMTTSAIATAGSSATPSTLVPYLAVRDGAEAIAWYGDVLGAVEAVRFTGDDGRLGHVELRVGDAIWYLADEYPEMGVVGPASLGNTSVALHLTVGDVDATFERAVAAGATALQPPADQPHGSRHGTMLDPFGHRWMLSTPIADPTIEEIDAATDGFTVTPGGDPA